MVQEEPIFSEVVQQVTEKSSLSLPLELVIDILRLLDDSSLAKCAVVCRTWLTLTRPSLFTNLILTKGRQTRLLSHFSDLFSHPLSTISSLVTSLTIIDPHNKKLYFKVLPFLTSFVNVQHLEIRSEGVFRASGEFPMAIRTKHYQTITSLKVDTDFPDFNRLTAFISDFPVLETLDLDADWAGPPTASPSSFPPPSLRTLRIKSLASFIIPWFLSSSQLPPIEDLELLVDDGELPVMNQFIHALGPSLRKLGLSLLEPLSDHGDSLYLNLNSSLESVQFKLYNNPIAALSISLTLRQVHIEIASSHQHWISDVDAIISSLPFQKAREPYMSSSVDTDSSILFPRCREKEVVCIIDTVGE